jgi:hypothetical protein
MDPTMLPNPIGTAPRAEQNPVPVLLYCPNERRWYTGVWREGGWRLQGQAERVLNPSHWLPATTDVVVESDMRFKKNPPIGSDGG